MVLLKDKNVLDKDNYVISLNGEQVDINAIKIAQKDTEVRQNTNKETFHSEGILSIYISFNTNLFNKEIAMYIKTHRWIFMKIVHQNHFRGQDNFLPSIVGMLDLCLILRFATRFFVFM